MLAAKVGQWAKALEIFEKIPSEFSKAAKKAVHKEAQFLRTQIVQGIKDQAPAGQQFKPLAPTTIAVRKFKGFNGTKALIVTGDLRNSVQVIDANGSVFIGISRTAKNKQGKNLVDVAAIHEFGSGPITIPITPKMRAFLMAAFRKAGLQGPYGNGSGVIVTRIPARPFIKPVFDKFGGKGSRDRIEAEMMKLLKGVLAP